MDIYSLLSSFDNVEKAELPIDYNLLLHDFDDDGAKVKMKYRITDVLGQGGSSIVYKAERIESVRYRDEVLEAPHIQVIKEYYPSQLVNSIKREKDGTLTIADSARDAFEKGRKRFLNGYIIHSNMERVHQNQTITPVDILSGNNTEYIVMESSEGIPLNKCRDEIKTITDISEIMLSLSMAIRRYHKTDNHYVHLDIKPANILKVKNTNIVFIFDFDSIQKVSDIKDGNYAFLSFSSEWAAPEQRQTGRHKDITEVTDLFSIGAVFFWLLTNRNLDVNNDILFSGGNWNLGSDNRYLENVDHRCVGIVKEILSATLEPAPSCRCQDIDTLINMFSRLHELSLQREFFGNEIESIALKKRTHSNELINIKKKLQQNRCVIVPASDYEVKRNLFKEYIRNSRSKYNAVYWLPFRDSIMDTIVSELSVENSILKDDMSKEALYGYKMRILFGHKKDTLLIIDGYRGDVDDDKHLDDLIDNGEFQLVILRHD
ncbi:MAG: hypothetical protein LBN34_07225 [Clostridiales Family XIII bacterium]|jgi:serine/threonine protein kinase|nr:hypothetical protein [Clostridiales Family XIII bacterium]